MRSVSICRKMTCQEQKTTLQLQKYINNHKPQAELKKSNLLLIKKAGIISRRRKTPVIVIADHQIVKSAIGYYVCLMPRVAFPFSG
jgi:hypothetical protein